MKLVSYRQGSSVKVGAMQGETVVDITGQIPDMLTIVKEGKKALEKIEQFLQTNPQGEALDPKQLLSPIPKVERNIMCIGWNYLEHFHERTQQHIQLPEKPTVFTKATSTVAGPYEDIPVSETLAKELDYEAEVAIVIGTEGKNIREEDALNHVFGYMAANDLSLRDVQKAHGNQWFLGKSMDKSCPMGPWLVTQDEVPNPQNLELSCILNGNVMQSANTELMIFPIARIIAELSRVITLVPGDIVLTGTPSGIGSKRNPPVFLRPGDLVEVELSGIGKISNRITKL